MKTLGVLILISNLFGCSWINRQFYNKSDTGMRAAAGKVIITPDREVNLAGYFSGSRKSDGVHDDLWARALLLEFSGGEKIAFISLDLIGLLRFDVQIIREQLSSDWEVFIWSNHQHSGPDTIGIFGGRDEEYMKELRSKIIDLVKALQEKLEPAAIYHGAVCERQLSKNWRVAGEIDSSVNVVSVQGAKERVATLVNFGCHPEATGKENRLISADFPGRLVYNLEMHYGGVGIFANGLLGGMVSIDTENLENKDKGFDLAVETAERLAQKVFEAEDTLQRLNQNSVLIQKKVIEIALENSAFRSAFEKGLIPSASTTFDGKSILTEVGVVSIGNLRIIMIPGEMTPRLGMLMKMAVHYNSALCRAMIIGLANDEIGYILPPQDFDLELYRYERETSIGKQAGSVIYYTVVGLMG